MNNLSTLQNGGTDFCIFTYPSDWRYRYEFWRLVLYVLNFNEDGRRSSIRLKIDVMI